MTTAVLYRGTDEVTVPVRLSQVPLELRQEVAHQLARYWKLKGLEYAMFLIAVSSPVGEQDVELVVPYEKWARVRAGEKVAGSMPQELKIPPTKIV